MAKTLAAEQIRLNLVDLLNGASDPSSGGGVAGAIGSFYLRSGTGQAWLKTGGANTDWDRLVQSFEWFSVKDYGAKGDNATNDTVAVQAAIDACAAAGGGVVWFPSGTYRVSQLTINSQDNVQLRGAGTSSVLRWTWNAAGAAGSMITITDAANTRISLLQLDGAGLTNPHAGRLNHLLAIGNAGAADVTTVHVINVRLTGMVANSGDGIHALGTAANRVRRFWIAECHFDGCSRYGVNICQGTRHGWVVDNEFTNCETDIAMLPTGAVSNENIIIRGNQIVHTGATRHAVRLEGNAGTPSININFTQNVIVGGFVTATGITRGVLSKNIQTSGAFASGDAAWRVFGAVTHCAFNGNLIVRDSGASAGTCQTLEISGGVSPSFCRVGAPMLINDLAAGAGCLAIIDCTRISVGGGGFFRSANAGAGVYGLDVQALTVDATDIVIGPGNQFSTAAGAYAAAVRLLANGADITDVSVTGNESSSIDFGLRCEVGGGGGAFNGILLHSGNTWDAVTGDIQNVGVTVRPFIGFNAAAVGPVLRSGTGSPEGVITARIGSMYLRTDGGQGSSVYYKESGSGSTGWVALGGWPLVFGAGDVGTVATALYLGTGYIATAPATEIQIPITRPGTIRNLRVQVGVAGVGAADVTFTVRKNGVAQTLTATIANTATGLATDLVNSFTVIAGDLISIEVTKSGAVATGQTNVIASVEVA